MTPLLDVRHLVKEFHSGGLLRRGTVVRAVDDVSFVVHPGEILGLVGESGSGKTTAARCVLRLVEPTSGEIRFRDVDVAALGPQALRDTRRHLQIVFQDPYSSLNPRMRAGRIVEEPLAIHRIGTARDRTAKVRQLFELVGLDPAALQKYPHEFSGGQRQRIGLARALALEPSLVVLDEPVSALDVSIQAQVINLLLDLRERLGLTYLFIAHDLRLVRHVCTRVAVMYRGRIVELAPPELLFTKPAHRYTQALLSAIPRVGSEERAPRVKFDGTDTRGPLREVGNEHFAAV